MCLNSNDSLLLILFFVKEITGYVVSVYLIVIVNSNGSK